MYFINAKDIVPMIHTIGEKAFYELVLQQMIADYQRWDEFQLSPRIAHHVPNGVLEQMPIADDAFYCCKFVNGHPANPSKGYPSIMATGLWAECETGRPLMFCDMTILTGVRTAVNAAIGTLYCGNKEITTVGIIGCGAQAAFQVMAHHSLLGCNHFIVFDIDPEAMQILQQHFVDRGIQIKFANSAQQVAAESDCLITLTAAKKQQHILQPTDLHAGLHINALGGDCPGKTEFPLSLLSACDSITTDFLPQAIVEGEIQQLQSHDTVKEIHHVMTGADSARLSQSSITMFDSVGCALQDFSICKVLYDACTKTATRDEAFIAQCDSVKDIYSLFR